MKSMELNSYWHNFARQEWESQSEGFLFTLNDQTALDYLPQGIAQKGIFQCLRGAGWSIPDAMIYVLESVTGSEHTKTVDVLPTESA